MSYFKPGFQEIQRLAQRAHRRYVLGRTHRQLDHAETQLGLLGWQQADFYGEIQEQVSALQNVEREQGRLTNHAGMLAQELQAVRDQRAKFRGEFESQHTQLEAFLEKARVPLEETERQLETLRSGETDTDRQVAHLDKELRDVEKAYNKLLLVNPQTIQVRDEILRLRQRIISIPNEKRDLKTGHARNISEIHQCDVKLAELRKKVANIETAIHDLREAFERDDEALHKKENTIAKEKEAAENECDRIERAKVNPYLEIGRVLADHNIAPMNQPEALATVLKLRKDITEHEDFIEHSLQISAKNDPAELRISLGLWIVVLLSVVLIVASAV